MNFDNLTDPHRIRPRIWFRRALIAAVAVMFALLHVPQAQREGGGQRCAAERRRRLRMLDGHGRGQQSDRREGGGHRIRADAFRENYLVRMHKNFFRRKLVRATWGLEAVISTIAGTLFGG